MSAPVLEAIAVSKRYPGVRALRSVSFRVAEGTIHALMGENGAGKSTLMKIIAGEEKPTEGELVLRGAPVSFDGPAAARAAGIAMVHQELTVIPALSVAENLLLGRLPGRGFVDRRRLRAAARAGLERIGAAIDVRRDAATLSAGEAQQVEIARALLADPDVLVLDEPTSSLSEAESARLSRTLRSLRDDGMAIVYVTHRIRDALDLADEATVLRDGEVVRTFAREELSSSALVRAMVGRAVTDAFPKSDAAIGDVVLEAKGLRVRADAEPFDLAVRAGEIVGLAGLVGSGRTETLRAIAGLDRGPGEVRVAGRGVRRGSVGAAQRAGIGFVPEERKREGVIATFDVARTLSLSALRRVAALGVLRPGRERSLARELIDRLGVSPADPGRRVVELSGGNQQKTVVGRAIADGPRVLLLDEPTRGVDVGAKAEVHRVVGDLVASGVAVVMASSEMPEVLAVSDRILAFADGTVVAEFARVEATEENLMAAMAGAGAHPRPGVVEAGEERIMTRLAAPPSAPPDAPARHETAGRWRRAASWAAIPGVLAVIVVVGALVAPRFLTPGNLVNVLNSAAIIGIVAVGMTLVLIVGGFVDLSVPATLATGGIVTLLAGAALPAPLAAVAGVSAAAFAGVANGILIGRFDLNPVVATLGTNVIILGVAQSLIGGQIIYTPFDGGVEDAVTGQFLGLPFAVWMLVLVAVVATAVLGRTTFGRRVYATGGNRTAALIAGVPTRRVTAVVFVLSAACAGAAGALLALQLGSVRPIIGAGYEFDAVTAVVVGGTSLFGGAGSVVRTMGGLLIVALTTNLLTLVGVPTPAQGLVKGGVIVAAVALDVAIRVRRGR